MIRSAFVVWVQLTVCMHSHSGWRNVCCDAKVRQQEILDEGKTLKSTAGPGARFSKLPVITGPVKLFCFPFQMGVKVLAKETKWTSLEVRTHPTFLENLISKYDFGPVKLPGLSRNGPLVITLHWLSISVSHSRLEILYKFCPFLLGVFLPFKFPLI